MRALRIAVLARDPDHPLLAATRELLAADGHSTVPAGQDADLLLLKARSAATLRLARRYEQAGTAVLNSVAATAFCQDRTAMEQRARRAGLPFAPTVADGPLGELGWTGPVVVKSRHSRREDLVARADTPEQWRALIDRWAPEPVITQRPIAGDGWDRKLWVVDGQVFAEQRRSELHPGGPARRPWTPGPEERALALAAGAAFGLDVYGIDLLPGPDGPIAVDVNAFPGIRHQPGAPEALAALAVRVAMAAADGRAADVGPPRLGSLARG
ncbi:RimK family alpha-L-glutamate ligase [Kitasatospora sp. NPDC051984]|uniref:RimK family alpha-L-glutamate ligase n=1 Tax=Kitasatospora sp. NPDC051984 TaxID=3364059 RepID=UPI0037C972CC